MPAGTVCVLTDGNISLRVGGLTARFLAGEWAFASDWNRRLFLAACDMQGRKVSRAIAEPLLLAGARPISSADLDSARLTIASAYSQDRHPST